MSVQVTSHMLVSVHMSLNTLVGRMGTRFSGKRARLVIDRRHRKGALRARGIVMLLCGKNRTPEML